MRYFFAILLLTGCSGPPAFHRVVYLPAQEVHVFSAPMPTGWAAKDSIGVSEKIINGAIVPDKDVLYHEIMHQLNRVSPEFANPDKDRMF